MIKQIIAKSEYKNQLLTKLSELEYFFIDKEGNLFFKDKSPIIVDGVHIKLGSLKWF